MNRFEKAYHTGRQESCRHDWAEYCKREALKEISKAQRHEADGDNEWAKLCYQLAGYSAARKKRWLTGEYFTTLGDTLSYFREETNSPLHEELVHAMLNNLHKRELDGASRFMLEDWWDMCRFYALNCCNTLKEYTEELMVKCPATLTLIRDIINDGEKISVSDVKLAWLDVFGAWFEYKEWKREGV